MNLERRSNKLLARLVVIISAVLALSVLAGADAIAQDSADWEVWALDQGEGINRIHIYDSSLNEVAVISFGELEAPHNAVQTPHMIEFDATNRYAVVASTASGTVSVIRTEDYQVIETIETGATAHMASFGPDNESIWVANIGAKTFTRIAADLENEQFEVVDDIEVIAQIHGGDWPGWHDAFGDDIADWPGPVCHAYSPDGAHAWITIGPADGGLAVLDLESGTVVEAFDPNEVRANCGLAVSADHNTIFANWSGPVGHAEHAEHSEPGEWYVFDAGTFELLASFGSADNTSTLGQDPHGARIVPDGTEFWQVNRISNDGIVVDVATHEIIAELELTDTPDILAFSPDGQYAFVALRGPNPRSMPHVAVGQTPGFEVFDVASRSSVAIIQPAGDEELDASDFHGIGVRGLIESPASEQEPAAVTDDAATDDDPQEVVPATGSLGVDSIVAISALIIAGFAAAGAAFWLRFRRSTLS